MSKKTFIYEGLEYLDEKYEFLNKVIDKSLERVLLHPNTITIEDFESEGYVVMEKEEILCEETNNFKKLNNLYKNFER